MMWSSTSAFCEAPFVVAAVRISICGMSYSRLTSPSGIIFFNFCGFEDLALWVSDTRNLILLGIGERLGWIWNTFTCD